MTLLAHWRQVSAEASRAASHMAISILQSQVRVYAWSRAACPFPPPMCHRMRRPTLRSASYVEASALVVSVNHFPPRSASCRSCALTVGGHTPVAEDTGRGCVPRSWRHCAALKGAGRCEVGSCMTRVGRAAVAAVVEGIVGP